jgi:hypothetical protein
MQLKEVSYGDYTLLVLLVAKQQQQQQQQEQQQCTSSHLEGWSQLLLQC